MTDLDDNQITGFYVDVRSAATTNSSFPSKKIATSR
jgi:hypothetical protein